MQHPRLVSDEIEIAVIARVLTLRRRGLCCADKNNPMVKLGDRGFVATDHQTYRIGDRYFGSVKTLQSYCEEEIARESSSIRKAPGKAQAGRDVDRAWQPVSKRKAVGA